MIKKYFHDTKNNNQIDSLNINVIRAILKNHKSNYFYIYSNLKLILFRLQEENEKSKQHGLDKNEKYVNRLSSEGEDLVERIKYHQELVDLERKVRNFDYLNLIVWH